MQAGFPRGVGQAAWFVRCRVMETAWMLTGDSLREDSHASPPLATPQTPGILASLTALCRGGFMEVAPGGGRAFGETQNAQLSLGVLGCALGAVQLLCGACARRAALGRVLATSLRP